ncbi:MAG: hypothetical protein FJX57_16205 [Alphaproteobacteria bacterium]|nr:hypothetical protein [Alphaproteobacteria bacterium]
MTRILRSVTLLALLALGSCAPFMLVPAAQQQDVRGAFTIDVFRPWNRVNPQAAGADQGPTESWTIDGPGLDQLLMLVGVANGDPLLKPVQPATSSQPREPLPPFRAGMAANEVMELFEATLVRLFQTTLFETKNLRPARLGDSEGFRFDYAYTAKDNIDRHGLAVASVRGDRLYVVAFHGPRVHHFPAFRDEVDRMIASIRFKAAPK